MNLPKVRMDWTVSVGHLGSVIVFILGGIFAYTDLKSDVRHQGDIATAKYQEYDRLWALQKATDDDQNQRMIRIYQDLARQMADAKTDIRNDIRDLRTDAMLKKLAPR